MKKFNFFKRKVREPKITDLQVAEDELIAIENVSCTYDKGLPSEFKALKDFSYRFKKNMIYCVIGNSGSGKSTMVQHLNGLLLPDRGAIKAGGVLITSRTRKIKKIRQLRKFVGLVFQFPEYQLFKDTIRKDIMFGPIALGLDKIKRKKVHFFKKSASNELNKKDYLKQMSLHAKKYLNLMGLNDEYLDRSPFELSGGQKRRVAIAGILAIETDVVIFDEPTAGLDPAGEAEMMKIITDLKAAGRTVIVVTHNMDHVLQIADEVLVMHNGLLHKKGNSYDIFLDQELLDNTSLTMPQVIEMGKKIEKTNRRYTNMLEQTKPRTVEELAAAVETMYSKRKK